MAATVLEVYGRPLATLEGEFHAYLRNYIALTITPPDGAPMRRAGYTLTVLRKGQDGRWRLARDANLLSKVE